MELTSKERISRILKHQAVDRIGVFEHFWGDTQKSYTEKGFIKEGEILEEHFDLDLRACWPFNMVADMDFVPVILEETEDTILTKDGNGASLRRQKLHDATPEHVDFSITCFDDWKKIRHFFTEFDERRIDFDVYRRVKKSAGENNRFFCWCGVNAFELIHPICGHEHMLYGMAADPDWIIDMADVLSDLTVKLQKTLFEREGYPDGILYYEDLGYKQTPFMSPSMYQEIIMPMHKRTIDYAHLHNLPVIMHSCGFVEPLLPYMIEVGIDCLQAIEVKAGMDLLRIYEKYGDKIALMGGIDVRTLYTNDKEIIDKELNEKIPVVKKGFGYVLHSDHSIPNTVDYDTFQYYLKRGRELGVY